MDALAEFLSTMPFWSWFALALGLLALELLTGTTHLLWASIAAAIVGVQAILMPDLWGLHLFVFALATALLSFFATPYFRRWQEQRQPGYETLNERGAQFIGKGVTAIADFTHGTGKVKMGDTEWQAEADAASTVTAGQRLVVEAVRGTVLVVKAP